MSTLPATLQIEDLSLAVHIGTEATERGQAQPIFLQLTMSVDAAKAALNDELQDAVNYVQLVAELETLAASRHYNLLETFATTCLNYLREHYGERYYYLKLSKQPCCLPQVAAVSVVLEHMGATNV